MSLSAFWEEAAVCFTEDMRGKHCSAVALGTISALLLLVAHAALTHERCRFQVEGGREATTSLYSLIGNICSAIGAILSRQLHLLVVMAGLSAALDAVSFIFQCVPLCLCRNSRAGRIRRARQRRRRQHLFELCVFMMVSGGFLKVGLLNVEPDKMATHRRHLQAIMENNHLDILGYVLGILAFVISFTSKFPAFYRTCTKRLTSAQVFSGVLSSFAAVCYASTLLLYDCSSAFIWRTMPWLLSAILCAVMDFLIVFIHLCKKRRSTGSLVVFSPDTESLLGKSDITLKNRHNGEKVHSTPKMKKKYTEEVAGTDDYLHVTSPTERQGPVPSNLFQKVKNEEILSSNCVWENDKDCFCSSDTSFDSSSVVSSDLEWDFEEANITWCEPAAAQPKYAKFSFQDFSCVNK